MFARGSLAEVLKEGVREVLDDFEPFLEQRLFKVLESEGIAAAVYPSLRQKEGVGEGERVADMMMTGSHKGTVNPLQAQAGLRDLSFLGCREKVLEVSA